MLCVTVRKYGQKAKEELKMSKAKDTKKETKKKPLLTPKEKKAAKATKKSTGIIGN